MNSSGVHALELAQAMGVKRTIIVAHPLVPCPVIAPARNRTLEPKDGALAALRVDLMPFFSEAISVAEAVGHFGLAAMCSHEEGSGYANFELAPRDEGIYAVALETHDGDLIGIQLEYSPSITLDLADLEDAFGVGSPEIVDTGGTEADTFSIESGLFRGFLSLSHEGCSGAGPRTVTSALARRTPWRHILADALRHEDDLVRLAVRALDVKPPELVNLAGTLGVMNGPVVGGKATFRPLPEMRNVAASSFEVDVDGKRDWVRSIHVTLDAPVIVEAPRFARAVASALGLHAVALDTGAVRFMDAKGRPRGTIALSYRGDALTGVVIERPDHHRQVAFWK